MPLLTIAMADVPAADAGLGSGIINVSQQVSGALGLAVLGRSRPTARRCSGGRPLARDLAARRLPPRVRGRRGRVAIGIALVVLRTPEPAKVESADEVHSIELVAEPALDRGAGSPPERSVGSVLLV